MNAGPRGPFCLFWQTLRRCSKCVCSRVVQLLVMDGPQVSSFTNMFVLSLSLDARGPGQPLTGPTRHAIRRSLAGSARSSQPLGVDRIGGGS